jgi:ligand-binding sensor domain-containing protein
MTWNSRPRSHIVIKVLSGILSKRKAALGVLVLAGAGAVLLFGSALWRASRSLQDARAIVAQEGRIPFRAISLDRPAPNGFESISSPTQFRDATLFQGRFYLCGPPGLFAYDLNGSPVAQYRPGKELPPAPLVAMASGNAPGHNTDPQLWIATAGEGLLAFDGRKFTQVRPDDAPSRNLTAVLLLASGRLLLGTEKNGVLAWDGQNLVRYHPALSDLQVTALAGSEQDLWLGTIDRGVFRWHAGQLDHFAEAEGLPDQRILSLAVDGVAAYAGTALGVAEFRDGRFTRMLSDGFFAKSLLVKSDSLVVGTLDEGIVEIPLAAQKPRLRNTANASSVAGVERLISFDGHTYALARGGLYEQSTKSGGFTKVFDTPGAVLADSNVSALAVDSEGRLWVGYFDRGLDILDPGFQHAAHVENEHVFCVNRIVHGADGALSAVGTANGLVLFDGSGREKQVLGKAEGLIANQVTDILLRGDSRAPNITVATPAGLTTIDASGTSSLYAFHGLVNNHVYALAASGSRIMAGTLGGLSILDSGLITASFTTANSGLKHNWITAIVPVANDWFIGTYGAGVLKFDSTGRWSTFIDWKAPAEINPNAMLVTDRAVYAGTLGKGLAIFNRSSGRWTFHTAGLPSLNVTALAANNGYLYVGADNGLVRIVEKELAAQ